MLTAEQKAMRRTGIGGSEIAAIFGESRFAAPFDVWLAKVHDWEQPETEDMLRGTFLEPAIANWYAHRFGHDASRLRPCDTLRHRVHEWALCTSDRLVTAPTGKERILSIKAPRRGGDDWGEPGTDNVPGEYLLQLQWEWAIHASHGLHLDETMDLAAIIDGELAVFHVQADRELQGWLLQAAGAWWQRHVVGGTPPSLDGSSQAKAWLKSRFPKDDNSARSATPTEQGLLIELEFAESEFEAANQRFDDLANQLRQSMGSTSRLSGSNGYVTWKTDKRGNKSFRTKWNNKEK